ncbi:hypothetical protein niasHT_022502 [Heterodera trifolii]|uniref:ANK_REP_REGION domain-containing protein n=1 Tax=Heterodera trifolii TaxID=157864 RepID=A0ABD2JGW9_9BILA
MLETLLDLFSISFILFPSIGLFLFLIYQKGNSAADDKNNDSFEDKKKMLNELFGIVHSFRSHLNKHFLECVLVGEVPENWSDNSLFALFGAALNGQIETLKILSECNDVNLRMRQLKTAGCTFDGVSLLWIASAAGHFEIVKFLHQKSDDVNGNGSMTFRLFVPRRAQVTSKCESFWSKTTQILTTEWTLASRRWTVLTLAGILKLQNSYAKMVLRQQLSSNFSFVLRELWQCHR